MLLPLSHWTHGRGVEASLLITASLEALVSFSCLSHVVRYVRYCKSGIYPKTKTVYTILSVLLDNIHHLDITEASVSFSCLSHVVRYVRILPIVSGIYSKTKTEYTILSVLLDNIHHLDITVLRWTN